MSVLDILYKWDRTACVLPSLTVTQHVVLRLVHLVTRHFLLLVIKTDLLNVTQSFNLDPCSQYIYIGLFSFLFKKITKVEFHQ